MDFKSLMNRFGLLKIKIDSTYYLMLRPEFKRLFTNLTFDYSRKIFINDDTITTNRIIDMQGFWSIGKNVYMLERSGLFFYVVFLDHITATNEPYIRPKTSIIDPSNKFQRSLILKTFKKYGYGYNFCERGIYGMDHNSLIFIGDVPLMEMKPFIANLGSVRWT